MTEPSKERTSEGPANGVIERLFLHQDAIKRHLVAPMLPEREAYLGKLLASGHKRQFVADRAATLCHIVVRQWFVKTATEDDILEALKEWLGESADQEPALLRHRGRYFIAVARSWTKFRGIYVARRPSCNRFEDAYQEFLVWLRTDIGFLDSSVNSCAAGVKNFLLWISPRCDDLASVSLAEVDAFIAERRSAGLGRHTIIGQCLSIRTFFRFVETRGWSLCNLSKTIRTPKQPATTQPVRCPPWRQVRQTLALLDTPNPSHCRARAILLLASVYGLRRSEISRLTLEDFDWQNEVLTVRRSKRGRTQQFPIQFEVGEAVIRYLKIRPISVFRNVFLTFHRPYRPAGNFSSAMRKVLAAQSTFDRPWGMHAFRHACATELLRKGTSLRGIADFLGHKGIQSVSIYAHSDLYVLRQVARIELKELLCD